VRVVGMELPAQLAFRLEPIHIVGVEQQSSAQGAIPCSGRRSRRQWPLTTQSGHAIGPLIHLLPVQQVRRLGPIATTVTLIRYPLPAGIAVPDQPLDAA
jgi:hypothetical protein